MIRPLLSSFVSETIEKLVASGQFPVEARDVPVEIDVPKDPDHGDFATNFALVAAKPARQNPRALAVALSEALAQNTEMFAAVEVAGPGFINFRLTPTFTSQFVKRVNSSPDSLLPGHERQSTDREASDAAQPQGDGPKGLRINVEFVSVNPNGPITIGSGRGAAFGSALCNVLEAAGNVVHREYYINDALNSEQMRLFAESVKAIVEGCPVPDNGYKGDYVHEVAHHLKGSQPDDYRKESERLMISKQREDLAAFGTTFDTWFSEKSLHDSGVVKTEVDHLIQNGVADTDPHRTKLILAKGGVIKDVEIEDQTVPTDDEDDGPNTLHDASPDARDGASAPHDVPEAQHDGEATLWLRSTKFGDDMDRVVRRRDGRLTYIAGDVAYHKDKFNRPANADKLITVLGPDHHGYIGRLQAVVAAGFSDKVTPLDNPEPLTEIEAKIFKDVEERNRCQASLAWAKDHLEIQIFQIVRFMKDGKPAPMRKRDGNIYALVDLINEIGEQLKPDGTLEEKQQAGSDVARFFYLMRHHDTAMDFDLELATKQSDENPVFYVQYAHARICSILDKAISDSAAGDAAKPQHDSEAHDTPDLSLLAHDRERALIIKICDLPHEVARTAEDYAVNRLTTYAIELARTFHHFYDACRVIQPEEPELTQARLALCRATKSALAQTLKLLGVSAPERM